MHSVVPAQWPRVGFEIEGYLFEDGEPVFQSADFDDDVSIDGQFDVVGDAKVEARTARPSSNLARAARRAVAGLDAGLGVIHARTAFKKAYCRCDTSLMDFVVDRATEYVSSRPRINYFDVPYVETVGTHVNIDFAPVRNFMRRVTRQSISPEAVIYFMRSNILPLIERYCTDPNRIKRRLEEDRLLGRLVGRRDGSQGRSTVCYRADHNQPAIEVTVADSMTDVDLLAAYAKDSCKLAFEAAAQAVECEGKIPPLEERSEIFADMFCDLLG